MLAWFEDIDTELVEGLLRRWPTLEAPQRARPATRAGAVVVAATAAVPTLLGLIRVLREGVARLDEQIRQITARQEDFAVFDSFPAAGPALAPRLWAAFGTRRERYAAAAELAAYSGIAPVVQRSGSVRQHAFGGPLRSLCGRVFTSSRRFRLANPSGRGPITSSTGPKGNRIIGPCGPWRSNGSVSCFVAGRTARCMTKATTYRRSPDAARRWWPVCRPRLRCCMFRAHSVSLIRRACCSSIAALMPFFKCRSQLSSETSFP